MLFVPHDLNLIDDPFIRTDVCSFLSSFFLPSVLRVTSDRYPVPVGSVIETAKNAARERSRVQNLRNGFMSLQSLIPNVPPDTKLSKLDTLILAANYIRHLSELLDPPLDGKEDSDGTAIHKTNDLNDASTVTKNLHPVKVSTRLHKTCICMKNCVPFNFPLHL